MLNYSKIFKQAYEITRKHKFLWIFGLFLILGNTLVWPQEGAIDNIYVWGILILTVLYLTIYFRSKAGLIWSTAAIIEKKEVSLGQAFQNSKSFFWKLVAIGLLVELGISLLAFLLGTPIIYMFEHDFQYRGVLLLIIGVLVFIPLALVAALVNVLAPMFIVLYNLKFKEAIQNSVDLIAKHWIILINVGSLMFFLQLMVMSFSFPIVFLSNLPYHRVGLISIILLGILLFLLHSAVAVFQQTAWTLVFKELVKPQKTEEEQPVVAPEIAS